MACVSDVVMTNDPFNAQEVRVWETVPTSTNVFMRRCAWIDWLTTGEHAVPRLNQRATRLRSDGSAKTCGEVRRFLDKWIAAMSPVCMAVSLPAEFKFPDNDCAGLDTS